MHHGEGVSSSREDHRNRRAKGRRRNKNFLKCMTINAQSLQNKMTEFDDVAVKK